MKVVLRSTEEFDLRPAQLRLIRLLSKGSRYLHGRTQDLADVTPGVYDSGEGKYALSQRGWRIIFRLREMKKA